MRISIRLIIMADNLRQFLKLHFPFIYSLFKKWYWKIKNLLAHLLGTKTEEKRWANRSLNEIKKGFTNLNHPHRQFLVQKICTFEPIFSILEVGCGYGPNLYLLAKQFPKAELVGIDINPLSILEGRKLLMEDGISNVELICGKADELHQFQDKRFDIVFTDALLVYIGPDKIKKIASEILRIARRAVILVEWHSFESERKDANGLGVYYKGLWKRDYIALLKHFIPKDQIRLTKIPNEMWPAQDWQDIGYFIEVTM